MKVRIVTFHRAHNYGAVLQCFALNTFISNLGFLCDTLDYWPSCFKEWYYCWRPFKLFHPPVKTWVKRFSIRKILRKRNKNFEVFIKTYIPLTNKTYYDHGSLNKMSSDVDVYVAGSDMIWNYKCCRFDPVYFLDFHDAKDKKRISYAASFGDDSIPDDKLNEYRRRIGLFDLISVRESQGKEYVRSLINSKAIINCDPTLLLTTEQWIDSFELTDKGEKHIFVYYVEMTQDLQKAALELSKQHGFKVVSMPCNTKKEMLSGLNDKYLCDIFDSTGSPLDFLSYVYNSEYILTNSFHGLVFSLLFHKKFLVKLDNDNHINVRAKNLMSLVGVESREFNKCDINDNIDWEYVDKKINILRNEARVYFNMALKK